MTLPDRFPDPAEVTRQPPVTLTQNSTSQEEKVSRALSEARQTKWNNLLSQKELHGNPPLG